MVTTVDEAELTCWRTESNAQLKAQNSSSLFLSSFNIIVLFSVTTLLLLKTPYHYKDLIGIMLLILFLVPPFPGIQEKNTSNESHG